MSLWIFEWQEGGYNSVEAYSRESALAQANDILPGTLTVDESTLRRGTWMELNALREKCLATTQTT